MIRSCTSATTLREAVAVLLHDLHHELLRAQLGERPARHQRELRAQVAERHHVEALAHALHLAHVALDGRRQHLLLAAEVLVEAAGPGSEPGRLLDVARRWCRVKPLTREQPDRLGDDPLAGALLGVSSW